jgi:tonB box
MIVAVMGLVWFAYDNLLRRSRRGVQLPQVMVVGLLFAGLYSIINIFAIEFNATDDYSYANYVTTFLVWIFSVYPAIALIRLTHGEVTLPLITYYLVAVTLFQCITGLIMDNSPAFDEFNSKIVLWERDFFDRIGRIRCFSTALDFGGVRFSLVLILIMGMLGRDESVRKSKGAMFYLLLSFFVIAGIGNMVARTTTVGVVVGLVILVICMLGSGPRLGGSKYIIGLFFVTLALVSVVGVYLYNTDEYYYNLIRFAFEGFFNLVENGEFTTDSTEVLESMWKWPSDTKSWIIGTGIYGTWAYGTDIGYCRLILYSGLTGFVVFALSFVYYAYYFARKYPRHVWLFVGYLAMTFIVWMKVSTDILMIYAFFFWFTAEESDRINGIIPEESTVS